MSRSDNAASLSLEKNFAGAAAHMPVAGEIDPRGRAARQQSPHLLDHLKTWLGHFTLAPATS